MSESIGMMEGAFFVSRTEIINWINSILKLDITKIEQACTGAIACQIMDIIAPGCISMKKVNWKASQEYEYVNNYKLLQQAFTKLGLKKVIEVEKLIKGKYQDNLEFMQWLKRYYDMKVGSTEGHDVISKRKDTLKKSKLLKDHSKENEKMEMVAKKKEINGMGDTKTIEELRKKIETFNKTNKALQKERDFFFNKLRDLEILTHFYEKEKIPLVGYIEKILYATEDDKITIDEKGHLLMTDAYTEDRIVNEEYIDNEQMELAQD